MPDKKNNQDFSMKQVQDLIKAEQWEKLVKESKNTTEKLQKSYLDFINDKAKRLQKREIKVGDAKVTDNCIKREFELSFFEILAIKGNVEICSSGQKWSAKLYVSLMLLGDKVWSTEYELSNEDASVTFKPDLILVKASFTIGIKDPKLCLYIKGQGCYYVPFKWHCSDEFDETLFCFR